MHLQMCVKYDPITFKLTTLLRAIARRLQQRKHMLPSHWSRAIQVPRRTGILHRKATRMDPTGDGMLDLDLRSTSLYLWMPVDLVKG